ncbi:X8 domain-containing protein [Citrus sinensis]|nr:X8 domain-containing protein [Citrus sinensis]
MGSRALQCFSIFLLHLLLSPGSSVAEKLQLEASQKNRKLETQESRILSSSPSLFITQLDANVPVVNPTTPGTSPPTVNPPPSPTITGPSPPSPTTTGPSPPSPTTTGPSPPSPTTTGPTITPPAPSTTTTPASSGGAWCIANPSASETGLQVALDYACGFGGADCSAIQPGASCYNPNTIRDHASYAFNDYYHKNPAPTSCVFGGAAQLTYTDPSKLCSSERNNQLYEFSSTYLDTIQTHLDSLLELLQVMETVTTPHPQDQPGKYFMAIL